VHERSTDSNAAADVLKADGPVENGGQTSKSLKNLASAKRSFLIPLHGFDS